MKTRGGFTLIELLFAMGLSLIVLAVGFSAFFNISRADDVERTREQLTITSNRAMDTIKEDVRAAESFSALGDSLVLNAITYSNLPNGAGIERLTQHGRSPFKGVRASYKQHGRGVDISIKAHKKVHGRVIRVELHSFVTPRN